MPDKEEAKQKLEKLAKKSDMEIGSAKTFPDAHTCTTKLIDLKNDLISEGYTVKTEQVNGGSVICNMEDDEGNKVAITNDVASFGVTVQQQ